MSKKHYRRETRFVSILLVHIPDLAALLDMLRYDRCVPFDQDETAKLYRLLGERDGGGRGKSTLKDHIIRLIRYASNDSPTPVGRWESYQCTVIDERSPDEVPMSDEDALRLHEVNIAKAKRTRRS